MISDPPDIQMSNLVSLWHSGASEKDKDVNKWSVCTDGFQDARSNSRD